MKNLLFTIILFLSFLPFAIFAQPGNDECTQAGVLNQTADCSPTQGTTIGATQSVPAILCDGLTGNADDDVWYRFTAATSSPTIYVICDPAFDGVVDVRQDLCNGTTIYCADDKGPGGTERVYTGNLALGMIYYIRIYSYGTGPATEGNFSVCVFGAPPYPPINNECYNALGIESPFSSGSTISASESIGPITCQGITGSSDDDVWFKFDAAWPNTTVTVEGSTYFDAVVDLRSMPCNGAPLFCADATPAGGTETLKASGLTVGNTYLVRVYSYGNGANFEGLFTIGVSETVCHTCPDYDFDFTAGPDWQEHASLISSDGCTKYRFSVLDGNEYTFKTGCGDGATADFDSFLTLYDQNCDSITSDDNSCELNRSKIIWTAGYNGFAYLDIHGATPDEYGPYNLLYEISDPMSVNEQTGKKPIDGMIRIFPNPATSQCLIESARDPFSGLVLSDPTGRIIRKIDFSPGTSYLLYGISELDPGLYFLGIRTINGWIYTRFVIVR